MPRLLIPATSTACIKIPSRLRPRSPASVKRAQLRTRLSRNFKDIMEMSQHLAFVNMGTPMNFLCPTGLDVQRFYPWSTDRRAIWKLGNPGAGSVLLRLRQQPGWLITAVSVSRQSPPTCTTGIPRLSDGFPLLLYGKRPVLRSPLSERVCGY